ncbi:DUF1559 domain-containing protein [bacterium]|nr:DUF1559 domain-containing protein [bacterium]
MVSRRPARRCAPPVGVRAPRAAELGETPANARKPPPPRSAARQWLRKCRWPGYPPYGTPFSFHPGGLHVAFGDGAVQFINETIASNVWQALARKADGTATKYQP